MKKKYIYLGVAVLFFSGCSSDTLLPETDAERVPIQFSVSGVSTSTDAETLTRAATDFPNSGNIAVLAANTEANTAAAAINWNSSNLYLNHVAASVEEKSSDKYPVTLSTSPQYWPFEGNKYLSFAAYSPASARTADANTLTATATASNPFPDLIYSTPTAVYNKVTGATGVELTRFKHAMARVVIKVIPVNQNGNEISGYNSDNFKITKLNIQTKATTGTFNFLAATPAWTITPASDFTIVYSLIDALNYSDTKAVKLPYNSSSTECYLLPATANNTLASSGIGFELSDKAYTYTYTESNVVSLDEFKDGTNNNNDITLEMGKTTTLTIKVKVMDIQSGGESDNILLQGTLKDWDYKGNSTVTIN